MNAADDFLLTRQQNHKEIRMQISRNGMLKVVKKYQIYLKSASNF